MSIHNSVRLNEQETRAMRNLIEEGVHYFDWANISSEAKVAKKLLAAVSVQSNAYILTTLPDHGWKPLHWVNWGVCAIFLGLTAFLGLTGHPLWATVAAFFSSPPFVLVIRKPPAPRHNPGLLDQIRDLGWVVAVHNDYKLNGVPHTFWLFTKEGREVHGEGLTDVEALKAVHRQIEPAWPGITRRTNGKQEA